MRSLNPTSHTPFAHRPITRQALERILNTAAGDDADISDDERLFVAAAELWAAARSVSLVRHLRQRPENFVIGACCGFRAAGAAHVARALEIAVARLRFEPSRDHGRILKRLELLVVQTPDDVDGLLERHAQQALRRRAPEPAQ